MITDNPRVDEAGSFVVSGGAGQTLSEIVADVPTREGTSAQTASVEVLCGDV